MKNLPNWQMNFKLIYLLFSFRKEIKYVTFTFLLVLLLPIIAVILLTHSGIDIVSDKLVSVNVNTHKIELHYPNGAIYKTLDLNTIWPVQGKITLEFGEPDLPFELFHDGIDIANPEGKIGDPVAAFADGKVTFAGEIFWGFGKHIIIDHGDNVTSLYGHLDKIFVVQGEKVTAGQIIGREGSTGWSTGPHLHFGVYVFGIPVNPRVF